MKCYNRLYQYRLPVVSLSFPTGTVHSVVSEDFFKLGSRNLVTTLLL